MLSPPDISFEMQFDHSEGAVWTVTIKVPGATIELMGDVAEQGNTLTASEVHIQIAAAAPVLTRKTMAVIASRVMEEMGYAQIVIAGAVRTTGARKGHRPRPLRFP
jgi:hypothetical protein